MLTIFKMAPFRYYVKEARKDYYRDGSIGAGEWFGKAAKVWGFVGEVVASAFDRMVQGFTRDGKTKLVQNAAQEDRYPGPDLTFTANKYVSCAWGLERDASARRKIEQYAVMGAAKDALQFVEDTCLFSRRGSGGAIVEKAVGMVACLWLHGTNRRNDMNLHVHACTGNQVLRQDGSSGTLLGITAKTGGAHKQSRSALYALRNDVGRVFQESLRRRMEHLGYRTADADAKYGFWSIVGMPKELVDQFSSRSKDVKRDMERRGVSGGREASRSARLTRPAKEAASIEALFTAWRERARDFDPATLRVQAESRSVGPVVSEELRARAEAKARLHVVAPVPRERTAGASNRFKHAHGERAVSKEPVRTDRRHPEASREERARANSGDDEKTLRAAATVARILKKSRRNRSNGLTRANVWLAAKQVEYLEGTRFSAEDKAALVAITRPGSVQSLGFGVRIEAVLKAAGIGFHRQGKKVLLVTDSHRAAERLEKQTGLHAITTTGLLRGLTTNRGLLAGYDAALRKSFSLGLGFRSGGLVTYALRASGRFLRLDSKTVLVVESASLGLIERADLLKRVQRARAKIIFIDRTRQATQISDELLHPRTKSARQEFRQDDWEREHENERR